MSAPDTGVSAWRSVALLTDYSSGLAQSTRRGSSMDIRAGLRALLAQDWPSGQRAGDGSGKKSTSPEGAPSPALPSFGGAR
jgi:hypothetical protein